MNGDHLLLDGLQVALLRSDQNDMLASLYLPGSSRFSMTYGNISKLAQLTQNGKFVTDFNFDDDLGHFMHATSSLGHIFARPSRDSAAIKNTPSPGFTVSYKGQALPRRDAVEPNRVLLPWRVTLLGSNDASLSWEFYLRSMSMRSFDDFSGLGKHFFLAKNELFSSEMHPRSGIQAIYDAQSNLVVKVEEYSVPPRKLWFSDTQKAHYVDEMFNYQGRPLYWNWGQVSEEYQHDELGRMSQVIIGKSINQTFVRHK